MLTDFLAILAGFGLLVWGADKFVAGAAAVARNLGVSPLIIGLTVVGLGTSAPEILVSGMAAVNGNPGLAIGNAIGSNIANIGLILGTTALIMPLTVHSGLLRREYPVLALVSFGTFVLMLDGKLGHLDGAFLLAGLIGVMGWLVHIGLQGRHTDPMETELDTEYNQPMEMGRALLWLLVGLLVLLGSSRLLVWAAVNIAQAFGVSDLVIGLTIVAIGTSLPELAAAIAAAMKQEPELAIGNVVGSNMYNLLAVLSVPGLIAPSVLAESVLMRDMPLMLVLTVLLFIMGYGHKGEGKINRLEGTALLSAFLGYQGWLYVSSVG